ncbi:nuclear exosome regulator NRDE2-like [Haemaphysalis longicornis]
MAQAPSLFPAYAVPKLSSSENAAKPALFPAFAPSTSEQQPPSEDAASPETSKLPDWLCNASYDPSLQDLLRKQPEELEQSSEEDDDDGGDDAQGPDGSLESAEGSGEESLLAAVERDRRAERARRKEHRKAERRRREEAEAALPTVAAGGKRRFRFLLGFAGEERFSVDPRPDKTLLAFDSPPFTELAVYPRGWRCDTLPPGCSFEPRKKRQFRRYWHPKAWKAPCVSANLAQPRLVFAQSERDLAYVPVRDLLPLTRTPGDEGVDPLRIHDASTRSYLQGLGASSRPEGGEVDSSRPLELLCPEAAAKQRALSTRLQASPEDEQAWLELTAFQDEFVAALEEASGMRRTLGRAKAIREKKLQVLEQGLLKTKGSVPLHLNKIQVLLEAGEEKRASAAWEELLRVHPGNARLWVEHARFLQAETTLSGFEAGVASRGYLRALACFRDMLEGRRATRRQPLDVERNILEVCRQYGVFLCQAGQWERAVATCQALAELSLRCPPQLQGEASLDSALALLEPFWDSGVARFGDAGARGWAHLMQLSAEQAAAEAASQGGQRDDGDCQAQEDEIVAQRGASLAETWLRLESLRDLCQWRPYRPDLSSEEVTSEDPERMVLFEDVGPALFRLREPAARLQLFRVWVSLLTGVDPEKSQTGSSLAEADCFERLPGVDLQMATQLSEALEFPSGWEVRQGTADFAHEVLSQAKPHFSDGGLGDELAMLAMRLLRLATGWDARKRKKCARTWLADPGRERCLDLWTQYGLLLVDLGLPQEALAVYEKALDTVSHPKALAECRGDMWLLLATYLNLSLGVLRPHEEGHTPEATARPPPPSKDSVLRVLSWYNSGRKFREVLSSPLQPSALLRASAAVDARCADVDGRTAGVVDVALWTKYFVSGFEAASALAQEWIDACPGDAKSSRGVVHTAYVRVCTFRDRQCQSTDRGALNKALLRALEDVPSSAAFLWQWVSLSTGSLGALRVRRYLDSLVQQERAPLAWLVALCFELRRARLLAQYRTPEAGFTLPSCRNHMRRILERAVESVCHRRCPLLWRLYIDLEVRFGTRDSAKAVFYRGLQSCPWAKVLYVDGVRHFPECLQEVVDMMVEKGIRLRAPLEELQLLREHASCAEGEEEGSSDCVPQAEAETEAEETPS